MNIVDLELILSIKDTIIMVAIPTIFSVLIGIPFGSIIYFTKKGGIYENKYLYFIINSYINIVRGFPFLIFVIFMIPFTRLVLGSAFGLIPASFPITFVGIALYSRFVEQSFQDVDRGILDLARSLKATPFQTIWHFLLVEARSSLILGLTSAIISYISYSSVMGVVGGGGIGDYAFRYGYLEYDYQLMYKVVVIIIIIIYIIQYTGNFFANKLDKKRRDS